MPSEPLTLLGLGWGLCALTMLLLWALQAARRDATPVDVGWAANLALLYAALADGSPQRRALVAVLACAWGLRLAGWLLVHRVLRRSGEDPRYRDLRQRWGSRANANFFAFFQAQAVLDALLSVPFLLACANAAPRLGALEIAGAIVAGLAVCGETAADVQLERFKRRPEARGRTCRDGLWRTSRHPNYFFEWLFWVGIALVALPAPWGWLGWASPILMLALIWKVTGIPAAEAQAVKSRGQDYIDYQRTTSVFVPWFPRSRS